MGRGLPRMETHGRPAAYMADRSGGLADAQLPPWHSIDETSGQAVEDKAPRTQDCP